MIEQIISLRVPCRLFPVMDLSKVPRQYYYYIKGKNFGRDRAQTGSQAQNVPRHFSHAGEKGRVRLVGELKSGSDGGGSVNRRGYFRGRSSGHFSRRRRSA